jgi:hypothetical protein
MFNYAAFALGQSPLVDHVEPTADEPSSPWSYAPVVSKYLIPLMVITSSTKSCSLALFTKAASI